MKYRISLTGRGWAHKHMVSLGPRPLKYRLIISRREAAQAKKEAESQGDVVQALRRDLAGAAARMSDMAGELSDKQKQKLEQYEERILEQDTELEEQRKQLLQLSALVDEQQKEINSREDKLSEQQKVCDVCKICNSIAKSLHCGAIRP